MSLSEALTDESRQVSRSTSSESSSELRIQILEKEVEKERKLSQDLAQKLKTSQLENSHHLRQQEANFLGSSTIPFCAPLTVKINDLDTNLLNPLDLKRFKSWQSGDDKSHVISSSENRKLQQKLKDVSDLLAKKIDVIAVQNTKIEAFSSQLSKEKEKFAALEAKQKSELDEKVGQYKSTNEKLGKKVSDLAEQLEKLQNSSKAELTSKDHNIAELEVSLKTAKDQLKQSETRNSTLKASLKNMHEFVKKTEVTQADMKLEIEKLQKSKSYETSAMLDNLVSSSSDDMVRKMSHELEEKKQLNDKLTKANDILKADLRKTQMENEKYLKDKVLEKTEFLDKLEEIKQLTSALDSKKKMLNEMATLKMASEKSLKEQVQMCCEVKKELETLKDTLKTCLERSTKGLEANGIGIDVKNMPDVQALERIVVELVEEVSHLSSSAKKVESLEKSLQNKDAALESLASEKSTLEEDLRAKEAEIVHMVEKMSKEKADNLKVLEALQSSSFLEAKEKAEKLEAENAKLKAQASEVEVLKQNLLKAESEKQKLEFTLEFLRKDLKGPKTSEMASQTEPLQDHCTVVTLKRPPTVERKTPNPPASEPKRANNTQSVLPLKDVVPTANIAHLPAPVQNPAQQSNVIMIQTPPHNNSHALPRLQMALQQGPPPLSRHQPRPIQAVAFSNPQGNLNSTPSAAINGAPRIYSQPHIRGPFNNQQQQPVQVVVQQPQQPQVVVQQQPHQQQQVVVHQQQQQQQQQVVLRQQIVNGQPQFNVAFQQPQQPPVLIVRSEPSLMNGNPVMIRPRLEAASLINGAAPVIRPRPEASLISDHESKKRRAHDYFMNMLTSQTNEAQRKEILEAIEDVVEILRLEESQPNFDDVFKELSPDISKEGNIGLANGRVAVNLAFIRVFGTSPDFEMIWQSPGFQTSNSRP